MRYILFGFNKPYIALPERAVVVVDLGRQFDEGKSPGKIGHGQSFQFVEVAAYRDDIRIANHVFRSADTDVCLLVPVIIVGTDDLTKNVIRMRIVPGDVFRPPFVDIGLYLIRIGQDDIAALLALPV